MNWKHPKLESLQTGDRVDIDVVPFTIGRALTNQLIIENLAISRVHCIIEKQDRHYIFQDTSTNGSLINGQLYKKDNTKTLRHGDVITLNSDGCVYRFLTGQESNNSANVEDISKSKHINSISNDNKDDMETREVIMEMPTGSGKSKVDELKCTGSPANNSPGNMSENGVSDELLCVLADTVENITTQKPTNSNIPHEKPVSPKNLPGPSNLFLSHSKPIDERMIVDAPKINEQKSDVVIVNYSQPSSSNAIPSSQKPLKKREICPDSSSSTSRPNNSQEAQNSSNVMASSSNVQSNVTNDWLQSSSNNTQPSVSSSSKGESSTAVISPTNCFKKVRINDSESENNVPKMPASNMWVCSLFGGPSSATTPAGNFVNYRTQPRQVIPMPTQTNTRSPFIFTPANTSNNNNNSNNSRPIQVRPPIIIAAPQTPAPTFTGQNPFLPPKEIPVTRNSPIFLRIISNNQPSTSSNQPLNVSNPFTPSKPYPIKNITRIGHISSNAPKPTTSGSCPLTYNVPTQSSIPLNSPASLCIVPLNIPPVIQRLHADPSVTSVTRILNLSNTNSSSHATPNSSPQNSVITSSSSVVTSSSNMTKSSANVPMVSSNVLTISSNVPTSSSNVPTSSSNVVKGSANVPKGSLNVAASSSSNNNSNVTNSGGESSRSSVQSSQETIIYSVDENVAAEVVIEESANKNDKNEKKEKEEVIENDKKRKINAVQDKKEDTNQYEEMENELQCSICSELFVKATTLNCSHTFCRHCIDTWRKNKRECPICRQGIISASHTLVLDNVIKMMTENSSEEVKSQRRALEEERAQIERDKASTASGSTGHQHDHLRPTRGVRRARGRSARTRGRQTSSSSNSGSSRGAGADMSGAMRRVPRLVVQREAPPDVIELDDTDSDSTLGSTFDDSDDFSLLEDYMNEDTYDPGLPGHYYGGYGNCYACGGLGHWAGGCPYR